MKFGSLVYLCIDMQVLFAPGSPWGSPWVPVALEGVEQIASRAAARTVFTRFIPPAAPANVPGVWGRYFERWRAVTLENLDPALLNLLPPLKALTPPARVFDKAGYSAFSSAPLVAWFREKGVDTVILTGAETDVFVLSTILAAVEIGYRVILVTDAVCSSSDGRHDDLLTLYHKRFSEQIETVATTELLEHWPPRE